jgi:rare lipoprotein A
MKRVSVIVGTASSEAGSCVQEDTVGQFAVAKPWLDQHHAGHGPGKHSQRPEKMPQFHRFGECPRIRPIITTALTEHYCALVRSSSTDPGVTGGGVGLSQMSIMQYWAKGAWRGVLQRRLPGLAAAAMFALVHGSAHAQRAEATAPEVWVSETGTASYYGRAHQGRRTASGDRFDPSELTAAHPWLPFGTRVSVTLRDTGRTVVVTITDRLYSARRVIDLSMAAARLLGMVHQGVGTVSLAPG